MNKYLYDAVTNAFYPLDMQEEYEKAGIWPKNGVGVDEELFASFQSPAPGKVRIAGDEGYPVWGDIPPLTHNEQVTLAKSEKQSRIDEANVYINSKQWPGKAALGRLKDTEKAKYNAWLDYLDALESLDIDLAPNLELPNKPSV